MKFQFEYPMKKGECGDCPMFRDHDDWYECVLDGDQTSPSGCLPDECPLEEVEAWHPYPEEKPKHSGFYMTKVLHSYSGTETEDTCKRYYNTHLFAFELSDSVGKVIAWRYNAQES